LLPHARMRSYPESLLWALEVARQTDTRVRDNPSFAEFMAMLEKACTARPYRSGGSSAR